MPFAKCFFFLKFIPGQKFLKYQYSSISAKLIETLVFPVKFKSYCDGEIIHIVGPLEDEASC